MTTNHTNGGTAEPRITQDDLRAFVELKAQAKALKAKLDAVRRGLVARLQAGAAVEPGSLHAHVRSSEWRLLNAGSLAAVLGDEEVEQLKALVTPTVQLCLIVGPRTAASEPPARVKAGPTSVQGELDYYVE